MLATGYWLLPFPSFFTLRPSSFGLRWLYDDVVGDGRDAGDVARDFECAPALAGRLGPALECDDAALDLRFEVAEVQARVCLEFVHHVALNFPVPSHRTTTSGSPAHAGHSCPLQSQPP